MKKTQILTDKTEHHLFQKSILPCLLAGENLTLIWVPHGGRRKAMVYLAQNATKFGFRKLGKHLIYYIDYDELTEETPSAYFQLMIKNLTKTKPQKKAGAEKEPFYLLKQLVEELLKKNFHLIFILGRFDELNLPTFFYNNLYSLWQEDKTRVHFIFAVAKNIFQEEIFKQYGQLRELLSQNLVYFPIHTIEDSRAITEILTKKYSYNLSPSKKRLAEILGGGHPSLIKACLRILNNNPELKEDQAMDFLLQQWEIKTILEDIWQSLIEEEKICLSLITNGNQPEFKDVPPLLLPLRIIQFKDDSGFKLFSSLFESFVKNQKIKSHTLTLDPQSGEILINGCPPKEKVSLQEYHLLASFLTNSQATLTRDQIADILWGKGSYEKYSDWAIDQVISQLRRKLETLSVSSKNLQTIRGRGYRWVG